MRFSSTYINYNETGFFSKIIIDYLNQSKELAAFYNYENNLEGLQFAIDNRNFSTETRKIINTYFKNQYQENASTKQLENISLLEKENCFSITTAHQPNIFTGPLYVIYKILHTIKMAETLKQKFTDKHFVPVFFMGSEDADFDELSSITIQGKKLQWNTKQSGAVGRMLVDDDFLKLIAEIKGQIGVDQYGMELVALFTSAYSKGKSIQQATFELLNLLFAKYGLLVLVPDDKVLKQIFSSTIKKEITTSFSHQLVEQTNQDLSKHYKTQATGRDINLFYLIDDKRERIERIGDEFFVAALQLKLSLTEMLNEIDQHPERFSPNVILRPVFQETILPNISFIGGGGELAYWMQLKKVFIEVGIDYPVLVLRNSFLLLSQKHKSTLDKLKLEVKDLFKDSDTIIKQMVISKSNQSLKYAEEIQVFKNGFQHLKTHAASIDKSLVEHITALETQSLKKIEAAEKKLLRAEKRKFVNEQNQIVALKSQLFPNNSLQERIENFSSFYAKYGAAFFDILLESNLSIEQQFTVLLLND